MRFPDLETLKAYPVAEQRPIDDQVEWLDSHTLVYSDGLDIYTVPADGGGVPRLVIRNASSPVSLKSEDRKAKDKPESKPILEGQTSDSEQAAGEARRTTAFDV